MILGTNDLPSGPLFPFDIINSALFLGAGQPLRQAENLFSANTLRVRHVPSGTSVRPIGTASVCARPCRPSGPSQTFNARVKAGTPGTVRRAPTQPCAVQAPPAAVYPPVGETIFIDDGSTTQTEAGTLPRTFFAMSTPPCVSHPRRRALRSQADLRFSSPEA